MLVRSALLGAGRVLVLFVCFGCCSPDSFTLIPQLAESYKGFLLLLFAGCFACSSRIGVAGAGQCAVCGALKVLWWLLAVLVLQCRLLVRGLLGLLKICAQVAGVLFGVSALLDAQGSVAAGGACLACRVLVRVWVLLGVHKVVISWNVAPKPTTAPVFVGPDRHSLWRGDMSSSRSGIVSCLAMQPGQGAVIISPAIWGLCWAICFFWRGRG